MSEGAVVRQDGLLVRSHGGFREVNLEVLPVKGGGADEWAFLILFEDPATLSSQAKSRIAANGWGARLTPKRPNDRSSA